MNVVRGYHFVGATLRDGRPVPEDGEWITESPPIKICEKGLRASRHVADALRHAPGTILCLVELRHIVDEQADKVVAQDRKIIARFDAADLLRADARASARNVLHLWRAPDVVKRYLESGDETLRVEARLAADAAADAAYAAADAAYVAADAAYAAPYAADAAAAAATNAAAAAAYAVPSTSREVYRARLQTAVTAKFAEMGIK
jgi:hypothetical protein